MRDHRRRFLLPLLDPSIEREQEYCDGIVEHERTQGRNANVDEKTLCRVSHESICTMGEEITG
jgi:hypothetical protein